MDSPHGFPRAWFILAWCASLGWAAEPAPPPAPPTAVPQRAAASNRAAQLGTNEWLASTWMGKNGIVYRLAVNLDGSCWNQVHRSLGVRGSGGLVLATNDMDSLVTLLKRMPPSAKPANDEGRMTVAWRTGTNTFERVYDRASPPREVVDLYLLCHSAFNFMVETLAVKHEVATPGGVSALAASPDPEHLVLGGQHIAWWNWRTGTEQARTAPGVRLIASDGLGRSIAGVSASRWSVHDAMSGKEIWNYSQPGKVPGAGGGLRVGPSALSPDGLSIVVANGNELRLCTQAGPGALPVGTHNVPVRRVAWSPDGRLIASVGDYSESEIRFWRPDRTPVAVLPQTRHSSVSIAFSPDSLRLAAVDNRTWQIRIYDTLTRDLDFVLPAWANDHFILNQLSEVVWSPDGSFIAVAARPGPLIICDVRKRQPVAVARDSLASPAIFSRDSTLALALCADGKIRFWDLAPLRRPAK